MTHIRPGSHIVKLIQIISMTGEIPLRSLSLLGSQQVLRNQIRRLTTRETFCNDQTGEEYSCVMFVLVGKGKTKAVRLFKAAFPILDWLGLRQQYRMTTYNHTMPSDERYRDRVIRTAWAVIMSMEAGIECRPQFLPAEKLSTFMSLQLTEPVMYRSRDLKGLRTQEMNKTMFTRIVGAFMMGDHCYAAYNTMNTKMKWSGKGEIKSREYLQMLTQSCGLRYDHISAILFTHSFETAIQTITQTNYYIKEKERFDKVYTDVFMIPLAKEGIQMLQIMTIPDWQDKLLDIALNKGERTRDSYLFECDGKRDGRFLLSHLDSDIARLVRVKEAIENWAELNFEIICYPHQAEDIRAYLGESVEIRCIDLDFVVKKLGIKSRRIYERGWVQEELKKQEDDCIVEQWDDEPAYEIDCIYYQDDESDCEQEQPEQDRELPEEQAAPHEEAVAEKKESSSLPKTEVPAKPMPKDRNGTKKADNFLAKIRNMLKRD